MIFRNSRTIKSAVFLVIMVFATLPAYAEWVLDSRNTVFTFVTTKAVNKSEVQKFNRIDGAVSQDGKINVAIDLTSVDTGISIRNERMLSMLFEVTKYPTTARFTGQLRPDFFKELKKAGTLETYVDGYLEMHGVKESLKISLRAFSENGSIWVVASQPILISGKSYGMGAGIESMREMMGLSSINDEVAASFILKFDWKK